MPRKLLQVGIAVAAALVPLGSLSTDFLRIRSTLAFGNSFRLELVDENLVLVATRAGQTKKIVSFTGNGTSYVHGSLSVSNELSARTLRINGVPQWTIAHTELFDRRPSGWDNPRTDLITRCASLPMLGGYGKFAKGEISKSFQKLPLDHSYLRIKANFHFIDRWNGQTAFMRANIGKDGTMVHIWTDRHTQDTDIGINICGSPVPDNHFSVPIDVSFPHDVDTVRIGFGTTMDTDDSLDASWGISALEIHVK